MYFHHYKNPIILFILGTMNNIACETYLILGGEAIETSRQLCCRIHNFGLCNGNLLCGGYLYCIYSTVFYRLPSWDSSSYGYF